MFILLKLIFWQVKLNANHWPGNLLPYARPELPTIKQNEHTSSTNLHRLPSHGNFG